MLRSGRPADDAAAHGVCPAPRVGASCVGVHGPSAREDKTLFTFMGNTFTTASTGIPANQGGAESTSPTRVVSQSIKNQRDDAHSEQSCALANGQDTVKRQCDLHTTGLHPPLTTHFTPLVYNLEYDLRTQQLRGLTYRYTYRSQFLLTRFRSPTTSRSRLP